LDAQLELLPADEQVEDAGLFEDDFDPKRVAGGGGLAAAGTQ